MAKGVLFLLLLLAQFPAWGARYKIYDLPAPNYPEACLEMGLEGTVILEITLNARGQMADVKVVREPRNCPQFAVEALAAVRKATFYAPPRGHHVVQQTVRIPVTFSINNR